MGLGPVGEAAWRVARDCGDVACRLGVVRFEGGAELLGDGVRQVLGHAAGHHLSEHVGRIGFGVAQVAAEHPTRSTMHRAGEQAIRDSGIGWTFLRPTAYMSNALNCSGMIAADQVVHAPFAAGRAAVGLRAHGPEPLSPPDRIAVLSQTEDALRGGERKPSQTPASRSQTRGPSRHLRWRRPGCRRRCSPTASTTRRQRTAERVNVRPCAKKYPHLQARRHNRHYRV